MGADKFSNGHMACLALAMCCSKSIKPTDHFNTLIVTEFLHNRIYCFEYIKYLRAWAADYFLPHHNYAFSIYCMAI